MQKSFDSIWLYTPCLRGNEINELKLFQSIPALRDKDGSKRYNIPKIYKNELDIFHNNLNYEFFLFPDFCRMSFTYIPWMQYLDVQFLSQVEPRSDFSKLCIFKGYCRMYAGVKGWPSKSKVSKEVSIVDGQSTYNRNRWLLLSTLTNYRAPAGLYFSKASQNSIYRMTDELLYPIFY